MVLSRNTGYRWTGRVVSGKVEVQVTVETSNYDSGRSIEVSQMELF